ncbi:calpain-9-like isoform X2 [Portunus trituberculatus]|uniref:calpain-9-like isoform X2 n=1 Tax=Portunus trituberculatus TaxID=210409 RepID=UPI001E1CD315|nr:calpain-9-like isoform X2 [Portunus trituberculatus]
MGCGASQPSSPSSPFLRSPRSPPGKTEGRGVGLTNGNAPVSVAGEEVQVVEEAREVPKSMESGAFELPETDFEDGRLGIMEAEAVENLRNSLAPEELFTDDSFPADPSSLFLSGRADADVVWQRPHELVDSPYLFVDGASRRDVVQGALGDCWFLSSCAAVARKPKLIERVVPPDQALDGEGYTGLVVCRLWRFGAWVLVVVDDRLPTKNDMLIFARSTHPQEFWVALLEKAYAKLHGSYEALEGGQSMDAMVDLTGGLAERFDLEDTPDKRRFFKLLMTASRGGAFITASRKKDQPYDTQWLNCGDWRLAYRTDEHGLVEGHAYTVSGVATVSHDSLGPVSLVRVRNPWANAAEWTGAWADGDEKWCGVDSKQKNRLGAGRSSSSLRDGEFWMSYEDFCDQFEEVTVCTLGPDYDHDGTVDAVGQVKAIRGEWVAGSTAGGSRNDFEKFATNPQFLLKVDEAESDGSEGLNGSCSVLVAVMQEHRRSRRDFGVKMLQIGFVVYKTRDPTKPLPADYFYHHYEESSSGVYINYREVLARLELTPGCYSIIPATFTPDTPGQFMVRVYSPRPFHLSPLPPPTTPPAASEG